MGQIAVSYKHYCLSAHNITPYCILLQNPEVFGVVEGCDIISERKRSARETAQRPVAGKQSITCARLCTTPWDSRSRIMHDAFQNYDSA